MNLSKQKASSTMKNLKYKEPLIEFVICEEVPESASMICITVMFFDDTEINFPPTCLN